jgi:hypothetical protein
VGSAVPQGSEKRNKQKQLKFEEFYGPSIEEAEAKARASVGDILIGIEVVRDIQETSSSAQARSAEEALQLVSKRVPDKAFDPQKPTILQEGQAGTVEVEELVEFEAKKAWRRHAPRGAQMDSIECSSPPKNGVLGLGKKPGIWKVGWSAPYIAEVRYKMMAVVRARYFA